MPSTYLTITLSNNSGITLTQTFATISASIEFLNLSENNLGDKACTELVQAFAIIPTSVKSLNLSMNTFYKKTGTELAQILAIIPASVNHLDLSFNALGKKTNTELTQIFAAIPASVTSLNVSYNVFGDKTSKELIEIFAIIPTSVRSLDWSSNKLYRKTGAKLAQIFAAIPTSVSSLHLSDNGLYRKTGAELAQAFAAMPTSIHSLDLRHNRLDEKMSVELAQAFAGLPDSINRLAISNNGLEKKTDIELAQMVMALREGVKLNGPVRIDQSWMDRAALSVDDYETYSDPTLPSYSKQKHQQAFTQILQDAQLARAIEHYIRLPTFIKTKMELLTTEILKRVNGLFYQTDLTYESIITEFKKIVNDLILPLKKDRKNRELLLLTMAGQVSEIRSRQLCDTAFYTDSGISSLYAFELACYAYLVREHDKNIQPLFNGVFIAFCHYLETGKHKLATMDEVMYYKTNYKTSSSQAIQEKAWQDIASEMRSVFFQSDASPIIKYQIREGLYWSQGARQFKLRPLLGGYYDDTSLIPVENAGKKFIRTMV